LLQVLFVTAVIFIKQGQQIRDFKSWVHKPTR